MENVKYIFEALEMLNNLKWLPFMVFPSVILFVAWLILKGMK